MIPPGAFVLRRAAYPFVGILGKFGADVVTGFEVPRRIHEALNMAARAEHEFSSSAEHPGSAIAGAPRADVIGHPGDEVHVALHGAKIDRRAENLDFAAMR